MCDNYYHFNEETRFLRTFISFSSFPNSFPGCINRKVRQRDERERKRKGSNTEDVLVQRFAHSSYRPSRLFHLGRLLQITLCYIYSHEIHSLQWVWKHTEGKSPCLFHRSTKLYGRRSHERTWKKILKTGLWAIRWWAKLKYCLSWRELIINLCHTNKYSRRGIRPSSCSCVVAYSVTTATTRGKTNFCVSCSFSSPCLSLSNPPFSSHFPWFPTLDLMLSSAFSFHHHFLLLSPVRPVFVCMPAWRFLTSKLMNKRKACHGKLSRRAHVCILSVHRAASEFPSAFPPSLPSFCPRTFTFIRLCMSCDEQAVHIQLSLMCVGI